MSKKLYRPELAADVESLEYDFATKIGKLHMPQGWNCNMTACIALFERIDANVKQICTFSGGKPSTFYRLSPKIGWTAWVPDEPRIVRAAS